MEVLFWLVLFIFESSVFLLTFFFGINWSRYETKFKRSPQRLIVAGYIVHALILYQLFQISLLF